MHAAVSVLRPALAAARFFGFRRVRVVNVVSDFQLGDSLRRQRDVGRRGFRPAGVRAAIGGAGSAGDGRPGFNQLLPVSQELLGPLGEVFVLGLLPYIVDQLSESGFLMQMCVRETSELVITTFPPHGSAFLTLVRGG